MSGLLDRTLGETVAVETVGSAGLWQTEADTPQLEAAILNLAINARDAMAEGGKVTSKPQCIPRRVFIASRSRA